jgi:hypothetical protein
MGLLPLSSGNGCQAAEMISIDPDDTLKAWPHRAFFILTNF